jgi:hypothetical protein
VNLYGEEDKVKFARIVFGIAATYGFIVLLPLYFLLEKLGRDAPPPVTHPEFYYGFIGLAVLWQMVFVVIAKDPIRYRPLMLIAILEKFVYTVPVVILYSLSKAQPEIVGPALVDPIFGILFLVAYIRTRDAASVNSHI